MTRMSYRSWLWLLAIAIFATGAMADVCRSWPEARARIEAALEREGQVGAVTGELPCQFAAGIPPASSLQLVKVWQDPGGFHASFRCQAPVSCLPFVVETAAIGTKAAAKQAPVVRHTATPVLVKSGQAVNLLWERGNLRLTRVMVSLDSGRAGERIRTRARDGGPIVPGHVIAAGWVRARE
jgi:hypothetical protein